MIDFIYFIFIKPLEFLMNLVFDYGYSIFGSYGIAIIVMSLIVNTAILPIYNKAESWQEEERALKKRMKNKEDMIKRSFKGQERFIMISTLYRQFGFSHLMTLRASIGFLLQIPFFFAAYHLLSNMDCLNGASFGILNNLGKPDALLNYDGFSINLLPIIMTIVNLASSFIYTHNLSKRDKIQLYGMAFLFLVLLYNSPAALTFYWTLNNIYSFFKNVVEKNILPKKRENNLLNINSASEKLTRVNRHIINSFWPAFIFILIVTFLYFPFEFYYSDPNAFYLTFFSLLKKQIFIIEVIIVVSLVIWMFCIQKIKIILSYIVVFLCLLVFIYSFFVNTDYGLLNSDNTLQFSHKLHRASNYLVDVSISLSVALFIIFIIIKDRMIIIRRFIVSICLVIILLLSYKVVSFYVINNQFALSDTESILEKEEIPENIKHLFTFSSKGKNIVIVMLDMFTGGNIKEIIEKEPNLTSKLDGFTWYHDAMSPGSFTVFSKPSIIGGEKVTPWESNKETGISIEEKVNKQWASFLNLLLDRNFDVSINEGDFIQQEMIKKYIKSDINIINYWPNIAAFWAYNNSIKLSGINYYSIQKQLSFINSIGIFKVLPKSLKKFAYNNGEWLFIKYFKEVENDEVHSNSDATIRFSQIDSYHSLSTVSNNSNINTFKFIINETTHVNWSLDEKCLPKDNNQGNEHHPRDYGYGLYKTHFISELCSIKSLIKWIDWMKENGVYDNTQIIFVSDHGRWDNSELLKDWTNNSGYDPKSIFIYPLAVSSLLLVKDFDSHGEMKTDNNSLIAIWDIPNLIKKQLGIEHEEPWLNKDRERLHVNGAFQRSRHPEDTYDYDTLYRIKGSIYNKNNWIREK